jgi:acyl carrier protein
VSEADNLHVAEQKKQQAAEEACFLVEMARANFGGNETKAQVYVRVRKIISDEFGENENKVSLNSNLSDLGSDDSYESLGLSLREIVIALEEEFDISVSDREAKDELGINYIEVYYNGVDRYYRRSSSRSFWSILGSILGISDSFSGFELNSGRPGYAVRAGNCTIRRFVNLIYKKLHG